ncbi:MAG: LPS export ABC transporter periplasmic protein LptC [Verrucomicrobia bacterium]|nr:LPS export ABC transporter periplasmic protein LptC [Verrucomicrobiota bacterium]
MKSLTNWRQGSWMATVVFFLVSQSVMGQAAQPPIEQLRVPVELYPDGGIKTQVIAAKAIVAEDGSINAEKVRIEMFTPAGVLDSLVLAEACHYDRDNEIVTSKNKVEFEQGDVRISGTGFEWHAQDQSLKILSQARVSFPRDGLVAKGFIE